MCEEEYVLISVNSENKCVYVEKQTFAMGSKEAFNAHHRFDNLKKNFAMGQPFYGYSLIEVRRKKTDNQSISGDSNYEYVDMVKFKIPETNSADINIIPNKFGGR